MGQIKDNGLLAPILTASHGMAALGKSNFVHVGSGLQGQVLWENQATWSVLISLWSPTEALLTCAIKVMDNCLSHKPAQMQDKEAQTAILKIRGHA